MDLETQRKNIRELIDLFAENNSHFTIGDAAKMHEDAGFLKVYDTAIPQLWYNAFRSKTGEAPRAVVWSYDNRSGGAPYALTLSADRKIPQSLR